MNDYFPRLTAQHARNQLAIKHNRQSIAHNHNMIKTNQRWLKWFGWLPGASILREQTEKLSDATANLEDATANLEDSDDFVVAVLERNG